MEKCNMCHRAGPDLGNCGSFLTCPKAAGWVEIDPVRDVVISCSEPTCGKTVALSAHDILTGRTRVDFHCAASPEQCGARLFIESPVIHETLDEVEPTAASAATKAKRAAAKSAQ